MAISALALAACAGAGDESGGRLKAVATTSLIADLVRNVGGEKITVESLMGPGVDPHLYRASEGDVRTLGDADIIFYNGLHLEAKMADVLEKLAASRLTVAVTERIPRSLLLAPPEFAGSYDPHIWFDVALWKHALAYVHEALRDARPADSAYFRSNARRYEASLDSLDRYIKQRAIGLPSGRRVIITAHDAFNYFGRAYGFEVRGLQGISTAAEAGAADVSNLASYIAERRIPAIFVESSVPRRAIEAVRAAVEARGFSVAIGGQLFSDALGDEGTPEGTYIGMVRHNVDTIVAALSQDLGSRE